MRRPLTIVALATLLAAAGGVDGRAVERDFTITTWLSGRMYLEKYRPNRLVAATSAVEGLMAGFAHARDDETLLWLERCTRAWSADQVEAMLYDFVRPRFASWDEPIAVLAFQALLDACPAGMPAKWRAARLRLGRE